MRLSLVVFVAFLLAGCGEQGTSVPSLTLLVDLPTPAGWSRTSRVPVSTGGYADLAIEPDPPSYADPYAMVLTEAASGNAQASLALAYLDSLRVEEAQLVIDSSLSRPVQGNQGYLIQYRVPSVGNRTVRELFFLWRRHDCRVVLSRFDSDTASQRILKGIEQGLILN